MSRYGNKHQDAFHAEIMYLVRNHGVPTVIAWILEVLADILKNDVSTVMEE